MTQRSLGRGSGIIAAKSCFKLEKWLKPVNRNMITSAMRPASLQEESRLIPSPPKPRRTINETTRTNKDIMCLLSTRAGYLPFACVVPLGGPLNFCCVSPCRSPAVTDGRWLVSCFLEPLLHLLRFVFQQVSLFCRSSLLVTSLRSGTALDHKHH